MSDGTTPRPWDYHAPDCSMTVFHKAGDPMNAVMSVRGCDTCRGRDVNCGAPSNADAALIVRAVNSHDDLVKALEGLASELADWQCGEGISVTNDDPVIEEEDGSSHPCMCQTHARWRAARSALEKAKTK